MAGHHPDGSVPTARPRTTDPLPGRVAAQPSTPRPSTAATDPSSASRPAGSPTAQPRMPTHSRAVAPRLKQPDLGHHGPTRPHQHASRRRTEPAVADCAQHPQRPPPARRRPQRARTSRPGGRSGQPARSQQVNPSGSRPRRLGRPVYVTTDPPAHVDRPAGSGHQSHTALTPAMATRSRSRVRRSRAARLQRSRDVTVRPASRSQQSARPARRAGSGDPVYVTTDPPVHAGQPAAAESGHRSQAAPGASVGHAQQRAVSGAAELPGFGDAATGGSAGRPSQPSDGGTVSDHESPAGAGVTEPARAQSPVAHRQHAPGRVGLASFREPSQRKAAGGLADVPGAVSAGAPVQASPAAAANGHGAVRGPPRARRTGPSPALAHGSPSGITRLRSRACPCWPTARAARPGRGATTPARWPTCRDFSTSGTGHRRSRCRNRPLTPRPLSRRSLRLSRLARWPPRAGTACPPR